MVLLHLFTLCYRLLLSRFIYLFHSLSIDYHFDPIVVVEIFQSLWH